MSYIIIKKLVKDRIMESFNIPVFEVALYFLDKLDSETEDCISNLKLQKLVYYAQGFVMALTGRKLFDEPIEAWEHGPVVRELYNEYRRNGATPITKPENINYDTLSQHPELMEILDEVYQVYGQFSAWRLRDMTHEETPWLKTRRNDVISDESMLEFFRTQIN